MYKNEYIELNMRCVSDVGVSKVQRLCISGGDTVVCNRGQHPTSLIFYKDQIFKQSARLQIATLE